MTATQAALAAAYDARGRPLRFFADTRNKVLAYRSEA